MSRFSMVVLATSLVLAASTAGAQTLDGPSVAWTDLAEQVLDEMEEFGTIAAGIGLLALGFGIMLGVSIERVATTLVAGAILAAGSITSSAILGAELLP